MTDDEIKGALDRITALPVEGRSEDATDAALAALIKIGELSKEIISVLGEDESEQKALQWVEKIGPLLEQAFVMTRDASGAVIRVRYRTARDAH